MLGRIAARAASLGSSNASLGSRMESQTVGAKLRVLISRGSAAAVPSRGGGGVGRMTLMTSSLRARVHSVLGREFTPSPFMLRARNFSDKVNAAGSAVGNSGIVRFAKEHPYATNIISATVKTSVCDILVQKCVFVASRARRVRVARESTRSCTRDSTPCFLC